MSLISFFYVAQPMTDSETGEPLCQYAMFDTMRTCRAQVVTGMTHNAGHNCIKTELVVTAAEWPLRDKFLAAIRHACLGTCPAYR